jgi:hypothetical protein
MTDTKPIVWPSYKARAVIATLFLLFALYRFFGVEPLLTGELTNIPADKVDRFDIIKELPALQRMAGPGAAYKSMSADGLRADGTIMLDDRAELRLTFLVPRADSGHDRVDLFVRRPGVTGGGWSMLAGRRWERGITSRRFGFTDDPQTYALPTCDLAAMIAHGKRLTPYPNMPYDVDLYHNEGVYKLSFSSAPAADAEPLTVDLPRAGRGPSRSVSFNLVSATPVEYGADCQPR